MISEKQSKIIAYNRNHDAVTLDDAVDLIGYGIYCNVRKYAGLTMSRMVKQGHLIRVSPGIFRLPNMDDVNKFKVKKRVK